MRLELLHELVPTTTQLIGYRRFPWVDCCTQRQAFLKAAVVWSYVG